MIAWSVSPPTGGVVLLTRLVGRNLRFNRADPPLCCGQPSPLRCALLSPQGLATLQGPQKPARWSAKGEPPPLSLPCRSKVALLRWFARIDPVAPQGIVAASAIGGAPIPCPSKEGNYGAGEQILLGLPNSLCRGESQNYNKEPIPLTVRTALPPAVPPQTAPVLGCLCHFATLQ